MSGRNIDPMRINPADLTENELRIHFEVLRERVRHQDTELIRLRTKPWGRTFLKMFIAVLVSLLMLFSGLLYTYAINKLTAIPVDSGAQSLLGFAIAIYIMAMLLQIINAGGS